MSTGESWQYIMFDATRDADFGCDNNCCMGSSKNIKIRNVHHLFCDFYHRDTVHYAQPIHFGAYAEL